MNIPIRKSVNILLLNEANELLLMCADDPTTTSPDGTYHGTFWFPVGGQSENNETFQETALRELFEETGLTPKDIELGPVVWHGEFDLVLSGTLQRLNQHFLVAKTKQNTISHANFTPQERAIINKSAWFSLEKLKNCPDIIYPVVLTDHLPDILAGNYPAEPLEIDLGKQPTPRTLAD